MCRLVSCEMTIFEGAVVNDGTDEPTAPLGYNRRVSVSNRPSTPNQGRLPLARDPVMNRTSFIVSQANSEALAAVEGWRDWPDPRLVLVGPPNAGKSHLAAIWAEASGARRADGWRLGEELRSPLLVEDADRLEAGEAMFHLLNAAETTRPVLMTARIPPRDWVTTIPDLRSRLNALRVIELSPPDDPILLGLIEKFFRERNIKPEPDVASFLARRIERSAAAAAEIVARIDEAAAAERREVNRAFAGRVLQRTIQAPDLFE
jgi:chromosomal replication initiation ATPase DnaA